jgi:hypothetical protein
MGVRMAWMWMVVCGVLLCLKGAAEGTDVLYLTWMHDPATTMTIQWHTELEETASEVRYHRVGEDVWREGEGSCKELKQGPVLVHTVELDELSPNAEYEFELRGEVYRFRTLPQELNQSVKFVIGGDAYCHLSKFRQMNEEIAALDPDFVVIGGDIAYTVNSRAVFKGHGWELHRWQNFFREWKDQMVTSDGRLIPLVVVVGNHDIKPTALTEQHQYYLFYELFAFPEPGIPYRTLDFGKYLSLFLLDSGHSVHIEGEQTRWLTQALSDRQEQDYKFALYHVGAYPSVYPFTGRTPKRIRYYWSPLFERYGVQVAFEHHNHAYKRTHRMKRGQIAPDGVLYMGDGSWGVTARKPKEMWYLEKKAKVNAVCVITLSREGGKIEAMDLHGDMIDRVSLAPPKRAVGHRPLSYLRGS